MPASGTDHNLSSHNDEEHISTANIHTATARLTAEAQSMMGRPAPAFPSRGVQDVTANFIAASSQLQPGELIKDDYFTLFEAVGALEVCLFDSHCSLRQQQLTY